MAKKKYTYTVGSQKVKGGAKKAICTAYSRVAKTGRAVRVSRATGDQKRGRAVVICKKEKGADLPRCYRIAKSGKTYRWRIPTCRAGRR